MLAETAPRGHRPEHRLIVCVARGRPDCRSHGCDRDDRKPHRLQICAPWLRARCLMATFLFAFAWCAGLSARAEDAPPTVQKLIESLNSEDKQVRRDAAEELGRRGEAAREAAPALIKLMNDPDPQAGKNAIDALGGIGPAASEAIPVLIDALDSRKGRGGRGAGRMQTALHVARALAHIGPAAIPQLQSALDSPDAQQRAGVARALGAFGPAAAAAIPALIKNLADGSEPARQDSVDALGQIGVPARPALLAALGDADAKRRAGAALALAQLGAPAKDTASALMSVLEKETDPAARAAQITALPKTGPDPARAVPLLVAAATDPDDGIRHAGINALAGARTLHPGAVQALAGLLKNSDPALRQRAAHALGRLGPDAASALPALVAAAGASDGDAAFTDSLMQIGPAALPALLSALKDAKPAANEWIFHTLRGYGGAAVPALTEALQNPKAEVRVSAIQALGAMGMDATPAMHTVFTMASGDDPRVQAAALRALVALHAEPRHLKPLLEAAMASPSPDVKRAAAAGMAATGGAAALGVDSLIALLTDDDAAGRLSAVQALGELGPASAPAVNALIAHFEDPALQLAIIETLRRLGPAAAPAVPRLLDLATKNGGEQRATILPALAAIGHAADAALPMIRACVKDPTPEIRASAAAALAAVDADDAEVLSTLLTLLRDSSGTVRRATAPELGKLGPRAEAAIPGLVAMLDQDTERALALAALKSIKVRNVPDLLKLVAMRDAKVRVFACDSLGALGPAAQEAAPKLHDLLLAPSPVQEAARKALARIEIP
jgi:HEAT repeat protein